MTATVIFEALISRLNSLWSHSTQWIKQHGVTLTHFSAEYIQYTSHGSLYSLYSVCDNISVKSHYLIIA